MDGFRAPRCACPASGDTMARARALCVQFCARTCQGLAGLWRCLRRLWDDHVRGLFITEEEEHIPPEEAIFHKDKIMALTQTLKDKALTFEERARAAYSIGLLAFTGGPMAGMFAAEAMREVALLLQKHELAPGVRVLLLQSVACWCCLSPANQGRAQRLRLVPALTAILDRPAEPAPAPAPARRGELHGPLLVKFWTCYVLSVVTCNNLSVVEELQEHEDLKECLQRLAGENWAGWPENFAEVLYFLVGFHRN